MVSNASGAPVLQFGAAQAGGRCVLGEEC
eukprot:SAG31_NODE_31316_length_369_cov_1.151852_1_plen_28_part_01